MEMPAECNSGESGNARRDARIRFWHAPIRGQVCDRKHAFLDRNVLSWQNGRTDRKIYAPGDRYIFTMIRDRGKLTMAYEQNGQEAWNQPMNGQMTGQNAVDMPSAASGMEAGGYMPDPAYSQNGYAAYNTGMPAYPQNSGAQYPENMGYSGGYQGVQDSGYGNYSGAYQTMQDPGYGGYSGGFQQNPAMNGMNQSMGYQPYQDPAMSGAQQGYPADMSQGYGYNPGMQTGYSQEYQNPQMNGYGNQAAYDGQYSASQGYAFQPSQSMNAYPPQEYTAPQAVLYTGPVPGLSEQSRKVPTPQMGREGLADAKSTGKPWLKWAIPAAAVVLIAVLALIFWPRGQNYTAEDVVNALYERGLPITQAYTYSVQTDDEGLLGTKGGYTSKCAWVDGNLLSGYGYLDNGGMIEVFASSSDAQKRLEALQGMNPSTAGHVYQINRVVMRLSPRMSASSVSAYQTALRVMFGQ